MTKSGSKPIAGNRSRTNLSPQALQTAPAVTQAVAPKRSTPWTVEAASRVYRTSALNNGGQVPKGSLAAKAMSKATKGTSPSKDRTR